MMRLPSYSRYNITWLQFVDLSTDGLYITKPVDPAKFGGNQSRIKAIQFEFSKTGFKKKFDYTEYLDRWMQTKGIEYLVIERGHDITELPSSFFSNPIKYLGLDVEGITNYQQVFTHYNGLQELSITCKGHLDLGQDFKQLQQLRHLHINAESIEDISVIWSLKNLEYLNLDIRSLEAFPEERKESKLPLLSKAILRKGNSVTFPKLKNLIVKVPANLKGLPKSLFSRSLEYLQLYTQEKNVKIDFPKTLDFPSLVRLSIANMTLNPFPELNMPELEFLNLQVGNKEILSKIKNTTKLKDLTLRGASEEPISSLASLTLNRYSGSIIDYNGKMDITCWPNLEHLSLQGTEGKATDILYNDTLKELALSRCQIAPILKDLPKELKSLRLDQVSGLEEIKIETSYKRLTVFRVERCPDFKQVHLGLNMLTGMTVYEITTCPNYKTTPAEIFLSPKLTRLTITNTMERFDNTVMDNSKDLLKYLKSNNITHHERLTLGYWLLGQKTYKPLTNEIREKTLALFRHSNNPIYQCLSQELPELNQVKERFLELNLESLKGKKITVVGNPFDTKKSIKQDAENIGMTYTTKLNEAEYVIVSKKAEFEPGSPSPNVFLLTELDLSERAKKESPKFLNSPETSQKVRSNLREILWSSDPNSEQLALEMLKKGGMPKEVIGEVIAIAKTSTDASVKSKYKRFLKGKITPEEFNLVSKNVSFSRNINPFYKLTPHFSRELLGRFALALYKRKGTFVSEFLNLHQDDYDIRQEAILNHVIPQVVAKPHYLQLRYSLTTEELEMILSLPEVKGKLKRLIVSIHGNELPDVLKEHYTLKEFVIVGQNQLENIPQEIYSLVRLSKLNLNIPNLLTIDERLSNLVQLKEINIYTNEKVQVHESVKSLPKLNRFYCYPGCEYYQ